MSKPFRQACRQLFQAEEGQNLIEYALVTGIVAIGAIAALSKLSSTVNAALQSGVASVMAAWPH